MKFFLLIINKSKVIKIEKQIKRKQSLKKVIGYKYIKIRISIEREKHHHVHKEYKDSKGKISPSRKEEI